jgi:hypothetical protein
VQVVIKTTSINIRIWRPSLPGNWKGTSPGGPKFWPLLGIWPGHKPLISFQGSNCHLMLFPDRSGSQNAWHTITAC